MAEPTGRDGPHVFVVDLDDPVLADDDRHHLERVLRLRSGDPLTVSDGAGSWRPFTFGPVLEPAGDVTRSERAAPELTVAFAPVKGERPEWAVQKLTEIGVDRVVPFVAERSVVRWDQKRAAHHLARLRKVAREAAMQSRRCHLPVIEDLVPFEEVAARPGAVLAERGGPPPALDRPVLLVGPEGGWTPSELEGRPRVGLGPGVLRAETAAVVGGSLLCALRTGIVSVHGG